METPDTKSSHSPPPPPRPEQEPNPKKLKMSTNSDDDDETCNTTTTTKARYKRRKIAIFFAYCGVGYQGMQKNPGAKTIESDLEEALFQSGGVPEQDRGKSKRYDFARSARTDKGVSAVGQVISGRFYVDPPGFVDRLNSNLSPQIRIFGYKRVTASFNAKKFCDRRRYVYLIPVFALDPCSHRDRESVMASLGSGSELVKCLECSERGRKVVGVMGKRTFEFISPTDRKVEVSTGMNLETKVKLDILSRSEVAILGSEIGEETDNVHNNSVSQQEGIESRSELLNDKSNSDDTVSDIIVENGGLAKQEGSELRAEVLTDLGVTGEEEKIDGEEKPVKGSSFCYGEKEKERFNGILKQYVGSHNFHNFTTRTKAEDPAARRFIISFDANTTVMVNGIEFVKCEVVGQSFMLHQIRKMIGVAVAIMRNCAPESLIETALQKEVNINVPTAPEVGLYLDECFFTSYNNKWKDTHEELSMDAYKEEAEEFKMKHIYSHIALTELKEGAVALWLHSLNHRNYPDLRYVSNQETTAEKSAEVESTPVRIVNNEDISDEKIAGE